jgi:hypothetical protein
MFLQADKQRQAEAAAESNEVTQWPMQQDLDRILVSCISLLQHTDSLPIIIHQMQHMDLLSITVHILPL